MGFRVGKEGWCWWGMDMGNHLGLAWKVPKHVSADTSTRLCKDNNEDAPK